MCKYPAKSLERLRHFQQEVIYKIGRVDVDIAVKSAMERILIGVNDRYVNAEATSLRIVYGVLIGMMRAFHRADMGRGPSVRHCISGCIFINTAGVAVSPRLSAPSSLWDGDVPVKQQGIDNR